MGIRALTLTALLAVVAAAASLYALAGRRQQQPPETFGAVPEFHLIAHTGAPVSLAGLKGKVWVADFFFTSCPGICPSMTANMREVQKAFARNEDLKIISFTVDPKKDTAKTLTAYAKKFGAMAPQWLFVTGDETAIHTLGNVGFKLATAENKGSPGGFLHSDRFILVDRQGRIRAYFHGTEPADVEKLIQIAKEVLKERG